MNRRHFLKAAALSPIWLSLHGNLGWAHAFAPAHSEPPDAPRILSLTLRTAQPLHLMKDFYHGMLDFTVVGESASHITFRAGGTNLTFVKTEPAMPAPAYHFAFNIPENKIRSARDWQAKRTALIRPNQPHLRDPQFPEDVVHFGHWNAHSVFFHDPAENLLEYIARHDLKNTAEGPFNTDDILYASEIGLVVDDVPHTAQELRKVSGWPEYRGGSQQFMAIGDEHGLLLVMKRGRRAFGQGNPREVFPTEAVIRGKSHRRYGLPGYPHEITIDS